MLRGKSRNFFILLSDAILYAVALTLLDINTVIPAFLDTIGAPTWYIGMASTLKQLGFLLPQFYLLLRLPTLRNQVKFISTVYWLDRPQFLLFLAILAVYPGLPWIPTLFLISFGIFCVGEGIVQLPWMNLLGQTVNAGLRGRLWGVVQMAGGAGSLLAGVLVARMLNAGTMPFPLNYCVVFGAGALLLLPSPAFFGFARSPKVAEDAKHISLVSALRIAWRNSGFRRMLLVQVLVSADLLTLPYYIVMVRHRFQFLAPHIGTFIFLSITGGILGGLVWGYLSDRKGNRLTIITIVLANIIMAASFLTAQFINDKTALLIILPPAFILVGMVGGGWLGFVNYMMEIGDNRTRLYYITLDNACLLPLVLLPVLGGILRNHFDDKLIYGVVTVFMILAFLPALKLKEPRDGNSHRAP